MVFSTSPGWVAMHQTAMDMVSSTWNNFNPGYLATITTSAELDCVKKMMYAGNQWIGGVDNYSEGTFRWIDGPEAGSPVPSFWGAGEPNGGSNENCLMLASSGVFQDISCTTSLPAFLIEFNSDAPDASCMFLLLFRFSCFIFHFSFFIFHFSFLFFALSLPTG
jgi:hypothetical protein